MAELFAPLPMKNALFLLLALSLAAVGSAADTKPIESAFEKYWEAYARKDFAKAAAEVLPSDLEAAKAELLPVFLAGQATKTKEGQEVVSAFFGRAVGKARETMTPAEVFAGLNRVVTANDPQFFELLKDARTSIIFVRTSDAENAEVHFQVTIRGESDVDTETLTKKNGRWWVRINEDPKQIAAQFKALLSGSAPAK
jgi:hypothetical protein